MRPVLDARAVRRSKLDLDQVALRVGVDAPANDEPHVIGVEPQAALAEPLGDLVVRRVVIAASAVVRIIIIVAAALVVGHEVRARAHGARPLAQLGVGPGLVSLRL